MLKEGQYRNVSVKLTDEVGTLYMDDQLKFVFKTHYLEEFKEKKTLQVQSS